MITRKLIDLVDWVNGDEADSSFSATMIKGVSIDTRTIEKGNLYIPLVGENFNGHEFVEVAIEKGAAGVLWANSQPNPPKNVPLILVEDTLLALQTLAKHYLDALPVKVIGITGSNGKTTTKDMVASVLATTYKVQKTEGNYNNHIGLPLTILQFKEETEIAILEMGMSGKGEIELLTSIARPQAAIITNIGESHLQDLGSREAIAEAKLEIASHFDQDKTLLIHGDEPLLTENIKLAPYEVLTFGSTNKNNYYPGQMEQKRDGTSFTLNGVEDNGFFIPILGRHNVNNALAAIAIGQQFGLSIGNIKKGLGSIELTGMRTELLQGKSGVTVINDAYNASPTSMRAAIELLEDLKGYGKKAVVLGDMLELGDKEVDFHQDIGRSISPEKIDFVFTFGELGEKIAEGANEMFPVESVFAFKDKQELMEKIKSLLGAGDIVLVKASRGMKLEEVVQALG